MKRLLLMLLLAMPAAAMPTPVSQLPTRCTYNGCTGCSLIADSTSGVCRTIRWSTTAGEIKVQVCDKGDRYELYRQAFPAALNDFSACTGGGCVDKAWGFRAFTSTTLPDDGCTEDPPTGALVDPTSSGFAGESRADNHARLLRAWWDNGKIIQLFANQTSAWVPWYQRSDLCEVIHLRAGDQCTPPGGVAADRNCMVTDEFSQVLLATAQGTSESESRVQKLVTTLQAIAGSYGSLPAWKVTRTGDTLIFGDRNSASDADARIVLALYIAARSPHFSSTARAAFRTRADQMAADFLQHDFRYECRTGRNGAQICHWLASGGAQADAGLNSNDFGHAGYYGDAVIALLAAYHMTGTLSYRDAAIDTVNSYLLAANFNGTSFSVPPFAFRFNLSFTPPRAECTSQCDGAWDYHDAPRAVSICKARYYASLAGVALPADLDAYCNAWTNAGGITATAYQPRYRYNGTTFEAPVNGTYENGLGLSLNFPDAASLITRLDTYREHFRPNGGQAVWWSEQCHGVYSNAFHTTNLGSAIGRDRYPFIHP